MLEFDEAAHRYTLDGRVLPSVSDILRPVVNLSGIPEHILNRKRAIGVMVHQCCQWINEGEELDPESIDPVIAGYVNAYVAWVAAFKPQVLECEKRAASLALGFAGTPDLKALIEGAKFIIDVKTVAVMSPATALQTMGYALLDAEGGDWPLARRAGVQLLPDGKFSMREYRDPADRAVFLSLLTVHNWKVRNHV